MNAWKTVFDIVIVLKIAIAKFQCTGMQAISFFKFSTLAESLLESHKSFWPLSIFCCNRNEYLIFLTYQ